MTHITQQEVFDQTFLAFNQKWNGKAEAWVKGRELFISIYDQSLLYNHEYLAESKYLNSLFYD